jgi:CHAD domain-containing protein
VSQSLKTVGEALTRAAKPFQGDVEPIHAVRVSTRRAAATLQFFDERFSTKLAARFQKRLKRIRRAAGVARDADVQVELLTARGADAQMLDAVRSEQASARRELRKVRRRAKARRWFKSGLRDFLRTVDRRDDGAAKEWMTARWDVLCRDYLEQSPAKTATIETLHRFRIRTKSIRYQLELLSDRLPRSAVKRTLGLLIGVQDDLGNLIDQATLLERLKLIHPQGTRGTRRTPSFVQLQRDIDRSRKAFLTAWAKSRERTLRTQLTNLTAGMKRGRTSRGS